MASCISQIVSGIELSCDSNKGGIRRVWLLPYAASKDAMETQVYTTNDGVKIPHYVNSITSSYTAKNPAWKEFQFRKNTAQFTTTMTRDDANGTQYYTTEITMTFGKMETEKRLAIASLALAEVTVFVEDNNGTIWCFGGDKDSEGAILSANTGQTGTNKTDSNNYSITLSIDTDTLPVQLNDDAKTSFLTY